jgi:hypothetical protein
LPDRRRGFMFEFSCPALLIFSICVDIMPSIWHFHLSRDSVPGSRLVTEVRVSRILQAPSWQTFSI